MSLPRYWNTEEGCNDISHDGRYGRVLSEEEFLGFFGARSRSGNLSNAVPAVSAQVW